MIYNNTVNKPIIWHIVLKYHLENIMAFLNSQTSQSSKFEHSYLQSLDFWVARTRLYQHFCLICSCGTSHISTRFLLRCFFSLLLLAGGDFAIGDGASPKGVTAVLELQMVVLSGQLLRTGSRTVIWEVCWTSYRDLQWSSRLCNGGTLRFDVMLVLSGAFCCSGR